MEREEKFFLRSLNEFEVKIIKKSGTINFKLCFFIELTLAGLHT